jgi:eukaryotic-like serine/threonine-protein kinase
MENKNTSTNNALYEHFTLLSELSGAARENALNALNLDDEQRAKLQRLLAAHNTATDVVADILHESATRMPMDDVVTSGELIGDYRVLRELGAGGMGTVLLAERADAQYDVRVAIKLMRGFPTMEGMRRLKQERQILATLDHPNVARLLDGGETTQGQPYLVMEYVEGDVLTVFLQDKNPSQSARLALFDKILNAVEHAHQRLVIHRDIKPSNVLVSISGEPKLLDFGIAKLVEMEDSQRQTSTRVWTPGYASPEQQKGGAITVATDVFSLGVLLREMLETPGEAGAKLDADLRGILRKATETDPSQRYATVEALREDLRRFREGLPVRAAADTLRYRSRKFFWRHRLAVAVSLVAIMTASLMIWRLNVERQRAVAAQFAAEQDRKSLAQVNFFFRNLLSGIGPQAATGKELSAYALLDRAREKLAQDKMLKPQERLGVLQLLGDAYLNAERYETAREIYAQAVAEAPSTTTSLEMAALLRELARLNHVTGRAKLALPILDRAQALIVDPPRNIDEAELGARIRLARVWAKRDLNQPEESEIVAAVNFARTWLPKENNLLAIALGEQGALYERQARYDLLLPVRREVVQSLQKNSGSYLRDVAIQEVNLARALRLTKQYAESAKWLAEAEKQIVAETGDTFGAARIRLYFERAQLALDQGDWAMAESTWRRAYVANSSNADFGDLLLGGKIAANGGHSELARERFALAEKLAITPGQLQNLESANTMLSAH